jgi:hypothetical protein
MAMMPTRLTTAILVAAIIGAALIATGVRLSKSGDPLPPREPMLIYRAP